MKQYEFTEVDLMKLAQFTVSVLLVLHVHQIYLQSCSQTNRHFLFALSVIQTSHTDSNKCVSAFVIFGSLSRPHNQWRHTSDQQAKIIKLYLYDTSQ